MDSYKNDRFISNQRKINETKKNYCSANIYFIQATDYAVAILLASLFLWGIYNYLNSKNNSGLEIAALSTAFGMHLNYLTGILWLPLLFCPLIYQWHNGKKINLFKAFNRPILIILIITGILGSIWYIRNWIVTGNPVYAFFPGIFGGKNIRERHLGR